MGARAAIVTGGGTGLGRAMAEGLADVGYNCVISGRREGPLEETMDAVADAPGTVAAVQGDVTVDEDRRRVVHTCLERFGRVDVLVNNAGINHDAPLLDFDEKGWRNVMATNLDAPFFMALQVLPNMRERHWGRIINITSVYASLAFNSALYGGLRPDVTPGDRGPVRGPAYHASKAGLLNLTRELAVACAGWGVTVNAISPGMIPMATHDLDEDSRRSLTAMTPLKRFGEPAEIANVVRFIASEESSFVTGSQIVVDGGWTIW